jgi:hypothetical protein
VKVFHCDHCAHLLFFENTQCVRCGHTVAYMPDLARVGSLEQHEDIWRVPDGAAGYRLCANYTGHQVCNWAVAAGDPHTLCESCRLTRVVPDLSVEANRANWFRLEVAKRRLLFTLMSIDLPLADGSGKESGRDTGNDTGLAFEFLAEAPGQPVITGHAGGVITVNVAEADDAEREKRRQALGEPYRTLVGHFRHESGHYYWDRLIAGTGVLPAFRETFGDERADYGEALRAYYAGGPSPDWPQRFISAYASAHPLEDWAESWAHYLHMVDTLETAASCGFSLRPRRSDEPALPAVTFAPSGQLAFERLIDSWFPLTYALNNLTRGLGQPDAYPFVLSSPAIDKLRFVHELVGRSARTRTVSAS